jgi:hypothetical protein
MLLLSAVSVAQIPRTISYQGVLTDDEGHPKADTIYVIGFTLYDQESGGSGLWSDQHSIALKSGFFNAQLGDDDSPLPPSLDFTRQYWLGITVGSEPEMTPRIRLSSVPYSLSALTAGMAERAETAAVSIASISDTVWKTTGSDVYRLAGKIGIGTASPRQRMEISSESQIPLWVGGSHTAGTWLALENRATGGAEWELISTGPDNGGGAGNLLHWNATTQVVGMTIRGNGNVGIGTTSPEALLDVRGTGTKSGNHVAYFENTGSQDADGIAIKINNEHTNKGNNFITFYNGSGATTGRIEGFEYDDNDWGLLPPIPNLAPKLNIEPRPIEEWFSFGNRPSLTCNNQFEWDFGLGNTVSWCTDYSWDAGTLPKPTGSPLAIGSPPLSITLPTQQEVSNLVCWGVTTGIEDFLPMVLVSSLFYSAAPQIYALMEEAKALCNDEGITYGSKGADYAEWLIKADPAEDIRWGQIVGVNGGKVSKSTSDAEQVMVVSRAPIVLGNQPPEGKEVQYERVAFMGQVHTAVRGPVHAGDYIVAAGQDDGFGIAVPPDQLGIEHFQRIVGRAWEDLTTGSVGFVNVVVGVEHNALSHIVQSQATAFATLQKENDNLRLQLADLKNGQIRLASMIREVEARLREEKSMTTTSETVTSNGGHNR